MSWFQNADGKEITNPNDLCADFPCHGTRSLALVPSRHHGPPASAFCSTIVSTSARFISLFGTILSPFIIAYANVHD